LILPFCSPTSGAAQVPGLLFWAFNGLLLVVDITGKPSFISRYRIQVGKNEPVSIAASSPGHSPESRVRGPEKPRPV
jgi:hypothetical protein